MTYNFIYTKVKDTLFYPSIDVNSRESVEFELIQSLTSEDHYDVNARPVNHGDDAVDVTIDIGFQQIISLVSLMKWFVYWDS